MNPHSLKVLEWQTILEKLSSFAITQSGKEKAINSNLYNDINKIQLEQNLTAEAKRLLDNLLHPPIGEIEDISFILNTALARRTFSPLQAYNIGFFLKLSRSLKSFLKSNSDMSLREVVATKQSNLVTMSQSLFTDRELEDEFLGAFSPEGEVLDSASQQLKSLRMSLRDRTERLKQRLGSIIQSSSKILQDNVYTTRDERYVLPVKASFKSTVGGIVHDMSASLMTAYVEPREIVPLNNELKEIKIAIESEIEKILTEFFNKIEPIINELRTSFEVYSEIDLIFARAKYAIEIKAVEPTITNDKTISIKGFSHPILLEVLDSVVKNDLEIGGDFNTLLVTGSNTGGKTVILKGIGLCVLMSKAGLFIPAYEATIYPFQNVFADIGDEQSLSTSLSTFSAHMTNIIDILKNSDDKTLVLLDEICAGTDPSEGWALAKSILQTLSQKDAIIVATTHYGELKSLGYLSEKFQNASVEFDPTTLKPSYKFKLGVAGLSNAIKISKNLGLDNEIVKNAEDELKGITNETSEMLQKLQELQFKLSAESDKAEELKNEMNTLKAEYELKLKDLNEKKKKSLDVYRKKLESDVSTARSEIKDILSTIRQSKSEKLSRRALGKLQRIEGDYRTASQLEKEKLEPEHEPIDWSNIRVGDSVFVKKLGQTAEIAKMPDKNGNVELKIGLLKTTLKKENLFKSGQKKKTKQRNQTKKYVSLEREKISQVLDLRGNRVEEALNKLEIYLDKANLSNLKSVEIIHGHGTGVLKQAVRDYLKKSLYIKSFQQASKENDGAVVAELR